MKVRVIASAAVLLLAAALPAISPAQDYPSRPIRFIVPFTPGTTADSLARLLGPQISQGWSVPVVVDNRSGASGMIGIELVAAANPDGYTFLFASTAFGTLAATHPKPSYDPFKSFAPVLLIGTSPLTLVVAVKFPATTVREFIDQVRKQPGVYNYGTSGAGSVFHLSMELFKQENNLSLVHVPYKGTTGVLADLAAGQVQASMLVFQTVAPLAQGGKVRMLAVMGRERMPQFPQVPTLVESGMPNMVVENWTGVMAPAKTSRAVIAKLNAEINRLLALPETKDVLAKIGVSVVGGTPETLDALVRKEIKTWTEVSKRGNIVLE
ncbi:MAG TPA: tripartite tricarboxylate transporter substrate binding protein [Burkholderiales bacterium]|nr:tripartite tricarboxylate transporter substrate binding protein [Burkholderiales bacterium]